MKEIDVATACQSVGERHVAVSHALLAKDQAPQAVGRFEKALAEERLVGVANTLFQQRHGREGFEDRTGRNGHLGHAVDQRMVGCGKQCGQPGRVARGQRPRIEPRSAADTHSSPVSTSITTAAAPSGTAARCRTGDRRRPTAIRPRAAG